MTLRGFLKELRKHRGDGWALWPHREIRSGRMIRQTGGIGLRHCPVSCLVGDPYGSMVAIEHAAEVLGMDEGLVSDIISAADKCAGTDHNMMHRPFTEGRVVCSLPKLRAMLRKAVGV